MENRPAYVPNLKALGLEVARLRRERGWSVDVLAGVAGISDRTIVNIESARKIPRVDTLYSIAKALDADLATLIRAL